MHDWYWAAGRDGPAGDDFVIANGQDAMWERVRAEMGPDARPYWMALHKGSEEPSLAHVLHLALSVVPTYGVAHNRFVMEAAQIPAFADFLRQAPAGLHEYVANPVHTGKPLPVQSYSPQATMKLGRAVSDTLGIEPDWFDY